MIDFTLLIVSGTSGAIFLVVCVYFFVIFSQEFKEFEEKPLTTPDVKQKPDTKISFESELPKSSTHESDLNKVDNNGIESSSSSTLTLEMSAAAADPSNSIKNDLMDDCSSNKQNCDQEPNIEDDREAFSVGEYTNKAFEL